MRNEERLDNQFYQVLLDRQGTVDRDFALELQNNNNNNFPAQFLWRRGNRNDFMLNVDMALARDFEGFIDPTSGHVTCALNGNCPDSPLLGFATEYANNNAAWLSDFREDDQCCFPRCLHVIGFSSCEGVDSCGACSCSAFTSFLKT